MCISLNGQETDTRGAQTVAELIDHYRLAPAAILVEHNGVALHRREWPQRNLTEGDRVEIVNVVAGG